MIFDSHIEEMLVGIGFDAMTMAQKNELITTLARREGAVLSHITDEYILNHHKKLKSEMLSETCDEVIVKGFKSTNGHAYRMKNEDQINFIGQAHELIFFDQETQIIPWLTEDLGYIEHSRDEWLNKVYREAFMHKKAQLFKYSERKTKINNATTHAEIVAISWDEPKKEEAKKEVAIGA
ncbi:MULTISPECIES: hypothetical protein [Bacillus cereus group]|uniref:DUF4376 domain-containing protein n=1 Tax=Bacillus cereus group TaxID=86661 RepID=UPI000BF6247A|nr:MULTISPECIES: hypothetical protein [Bacillus cereus group]PGA25351.1 hypothetical protein COL80_15805 [Bacillus thuringiensis]PGU82137.1 hypothetical protein COD76_11630 [Bacillus cereus]